LQLLARDLFARGEIVIPQRDQHLPGAHPIAFGHAELLSAERASRQAETEPARVFATAVTPCRALATTWLFESKANSVSMCFPLSFSGDTA